MTSDLSQSSDQSKLLADSHVPVSTTEASLAGKTAILVDSKAMRRPNSLTSLFLIVACIGVTYATWHYRSAWLPQARLLFNESHSGAGTQTKAAARTVSVLAAKTRRRDLKLYLNGLGTVTPLKTVTIRSRVDGELQSVNFSEGRLVREGDQLAQIDPRPFEVQRDQALGALARDEATLRSSKLNYERLMKLLPTKAVTDQDVEDALALVQQTEGNILTDKAMVAHAELQLTYCRIIAPITGRIGLRIVDPGNIVRANDPNGLAIITQLHPIALVFAIPQDDISRVQLAMRAGKALEVEAFDRDFKTKLATGQLDALDNQVDPLTGTVRLKAVFEDEAHMLFPNQFVNARLFVETRSNALVVPSSAVQRGPSGSFVYVVKSDETVELRDVIVGPSEGTETAIEKGLIAGETVVTDGLDKLQAGTKVAIKEVSSPKPVVVKDDQQNSSDKHLATEKESEPPADSKEEKTPTSRTSG